MSRLDEEKTVCGKVTSWKTHASFSSNGIKGRISQKQVVVFVILKYRCDIDYCSTVGNLVAFCVLISIEPVDLG